MQFVQQSSKQISYVNSWKWHQIRLKDWFAIDLTDIEIWKPGHARSIPTIIPNSLNSLQTITAHAVIANTNPMVGPNDSLPQPEDVTGVIAFLCGPESKFINGALIPIDGGYMCK